MGSHSHRRYIKIQDGCRKGQRSTREIKHSFTDNPVAIVRKNGKTNATI